MHIRSPLVKPSHRTSIRCIATFSLGARPDVHHLSRSTSPAFASRDSAPTTSRSASTLSFDAPRRTRRPDVIDLTPDPFPRTFFPHQCSLSFYCFAIVVPYASPSAFNVRSLSPSIPRRVSHGRSHLASLADHVTVR